MRVLWVTSRPIAGTFGTSLSSTSGNWLDAAFEKCNDLPGVELSIVSLGSVERMTECVVGDCRMYLLPRGQKAKYNISDPSHFQEWQQLKEAVHPDIIQIWGTEHTEYLLAARIFSGIPIIVYIQGVVSKVAKELCHGISWKEQLKSISLQDIYRRTWLKAMQRNYYKQAKIEEEILRLSRGAIVENDWCAAQICAMAPDCHIYRSKLPIKNVFFENQWELDKVKRHTIFTNAGRYPIKGHHILFEALALVKRRYPDVKLYIPGLSRMGNGFVNQSRRNGYENLLHRKIKEFNLRDNIEYTGVLSAEEMASRISECNVYAMPSCVENHSSSLIEAMIVGAPCVSSFVGGVSNVATHNENALLYNCDDPQMLAAYIVSIFDDDALAVRLSTKAKAIRQSRMVDLRADFSNIYKMCAEWQ